MNPIVLMLLPYLQSWDGARLLLRLLALPRVNPLDPLVSGSDPPAPTFATASLRFDVRFIPGLDAMPTPTSPVTSVEVASPAPLADARALFAALEAIFPIDPAAGPGTPRRPGVAIHKYAPSSYQAAVGHASSRTPLLVTDDSYHCAVTAAPSKGYAKLPPPAPLPWGKVLAICLRQPALAEALGLVRPLTVTLPDPSLLSDGGWVSVSLAPGSDAHALVTTNSVVSYAARIPPLVEPRPLFTSVLFPSTPSSTAGYDELFQEVIDYDDGFAKAVHTGQPQTLDPLLDGDDGSRPVRDLGMRIGWDDEQVTIWLNRQIDPGAAALDAPMGVFGYRVDVRLDGTDEWSSLCRASGPVEVGDIAVGQFDGELAVETIATQLEGERTGPYWLPIYYTQWTGPPLVGGDAVATRLAGHPVAAGNSGVTGVAPDVELRYGQTYEVRVRLMDHTGGGPEASATPRNPAPHPVETMPFRRWVPPSRLVIVDPPPVVPDPTNAPTTLTLRRPLLGYPAYAFTAVPDPIPALIADLPAAKEEEREVGLPDPDVDRALIVVEVQMPDAVGAADHVPLYSTTRAFPADPAEPLTVELQWVDVHDASTVVPGASGPLPIPTARPVRISVAAEGRADPDLEYFGAADVMTSPSSFVSVRRESADERALLQGGAPAVDVTATFQRGVAAADGAVAAAQRASGHGLEAPGSPEHRLAATMRLQISGLTMRGQPGRRTVFGCSSGIRHLLAPDASAVTFASRAELADRWIVAVRATVDRDWSWDALGPEGFTVVRDGTIVGQLTPTRSVHEEATRRRESQRDRLDLLRCRRSSSRPRRLPGRARGRLPPGAHVGGAAVAGRSGVGAGRSAAGHDTAQPGPQARVGGDRPVAVRAHARIRPFAAAAAPALAGARRTAPRPRRRVVLPRAGARRGPDVAGQRSGRATAAGTAAPGRPGADPRDRARPVGRRRRAGRDAASDLVGFPAPLWPTATAGNGGSLSRVVRAVHVRVPYRARRTVVDGERTLRRPAARDRRPAPRPRARLRRHSRRGRDRGQRSLCRPRERRTIVAADTADHRAVGDDLRPSEAARRGDRTQRPAGSPRGTVTTCRRP